MFICDKGYESTRENNLNVFWSVESSGGARSKFNVGKEHVTRTSDGARRGIYKIKSFDIATF